MIKEVSISNFLSIKDCSQLKLGKLNILIGTNGLGKSNLIEAVDLLHNAPMELTKPIREGAVSVIGSGKAPVKTALRVWSW